MEASPGPNSPKSYYDEMVAKLDRHLALYNYPKEQDPAEDGSPRTALQGLRSFETTEWVASTRKVEKKKGKKSITSK